LNPPRPPVKFHRVRKLADLPEDLLRFDVYLHRDQLAKLARLAAAGHVAKSQIVRNAIAALPE
jgi:hypothetical protein